MSRRASLAVHLGGDAKLCVGGAVARIKHRRLRRVTPRPSVACDATVSCSRKLFDRSVAKGVFSRGSRGLPAQGIRLEVRSAEAERRSHRAAARPRTDSQGAAQKSTKTRGHGLRIKSAMTAGGHGLRVKPAMTAGGHGLRVKPAMTAGGHGLRIGSAMTDTWAGAPARRNCVQDNLQTAAPNS